MPLEKLNPLDEMVSIFLDCNRNNVWRRPENAKNMIKITLWKFQTHTSIIRSIFWASPGKRNSDWKRLKATSNSRPHISTSLAKHLKSGRPLIYKYIARRLQKIPSQNAAMQSFKGTAINIIPLRPVQGHLKISLRKRTYSNTAILNEFWRLPKYSPIICLLRPLREINNLATSFGVPLTKPKSTRNCTPRSGFLKRLSVWG